MGSVRGPGSRLKDFFTASFPVPESDLPIDEWAERNMVLAPIVSESGAVTFAHSRYLVAPLRRYQDETTREINVCAPTRGGKNVATDVMFFWTVKERPVPWLQVMQKDEIAKFYAKTRMWPAADAMRWFDPYQPEFHVSRPVESGVLMNGMVWKFCGPSTRNLQSIGYGTAVCDEPWQYPAGVIDEIKGRLRDYQRLGKDKLVAISQAGGERCDDWRAQFDSGILFEWHAPCAKCGEWMPLKWTGLRDDRSRWGVVYKSETDPETHMRDVEEARKSVRFECPHCRHQHRDSERLRRNWNNRGAYLHRTAGGELIHNDDWAGPKISYRFNGLVNTPLATLVGEWVESLNDLDASGSTSKRTAFILKRLAEWEDDVHDNSVVIETEADGVDVADGVPTWDQRVAAVMTVDCQIDHYWVWIEAISAGGDTMVLFADRVHTLPGVQEIQERFKVSTKMVGLDVSDNRMKRAREIAQFGTFRGGKFVSWFALSGRNMERGWPSEKKGEARVFWRKDRIDPSYGMNDKERRRRYAKRGVTLFEFAADQYKDETFARYKGGKMTFHPSVDTAVVGQHFTSEHRVTERGVQRWKQIGRRPNHLWDCANMATVLSSVAGYVTLGDGK